MKGIIRGLILVFLALSLLRAPAAFPQGGATGAISGAVVDVGGGAVADADVQIINSATSVLVRRVNTTTDGSFTVNLLPVATYTVTIASTGFREAKIPDVVVRVTETTRMTAKLVPLQVLEKVEVQALVQTVETTTATTGQAIESKTIRELPLATQNFQQLLTLSSGAQSELNASAQLGRGNVRVIVNGQREDNNNYLIEGISATDYNVAQATYIPLPNPDVIQEFKVQTSLYDASQGRNGGGNVNAILKSGTRNYHGDLYEFFRNDVLNANEYFLKAAGQERPPVKQNIFGGSLGGPVVKEKLGFFFVNYQGTRQRSALSPGTQINNPGFPVIPTDRSDASIIAAFFPNGLPSGASGIDPVIHALLNFKSNQFNDPNGFLIPSIPGTPGTTGQLIVTKPGKYTDDQFTTNWDKEFRNGQDKISARFFFSDAESFLPFGAGGLQASLGGTLASSISATDINFPYDIPVSARFFSMNETHLFSPTLVNDFRFGFVHINDSLLNNPPVTAADLGIERPTNSVTQSIYKFTLGSSGFQIGPTPPADQKQNQETYNFSDTVSWVHGPHVFRFGGEYSYITIDKLFPQVFNGQLFFVNSTIFGSSDPTTFTDFQKLLVGAPDFSFGGGGVFNHQYRNNNFGFFAQDDWKVRPDLTLNLGLRAEVLGAFYDKLCHIGNLDPELANSGQYPFINSTCANNLGLAGLSGTGNPTTFDNNHSTGIAPRIGLAYALFGHHTTTIRAGYGIYYVREDVGTADQLSFQAPYLPVTFGALNPGCLNVFFSPNAPPSCWPAGATSSPNALPSAGTLSASFLPCQAAFLGFPGKDPTQAGQFGCASGSPGSIPTPFLFVLAVPRHFVVPNTQQWNLPIQRELGKQWVLEVGYVGTHAVHLRETRTNIPARLASPTNPITVTDVSGNSYSITSNTISNGPMRSPIPAINGYGGFQIFANDAWSHYNSLQATISRNWARGYIQGAYTFSRSLDATSSGNTALNTAYNDESDLKNSYGSSDFDRPQRFALSYRYDLPFFSAADGWKKQVLAGWSISGITIIQSGAPFSVLDTAAGTAFLAPGYTPTLTGTLAPGATIAGSYTSGGIHSRLNGYLNPSDFTVAPTLPAAEGGDGTVTVFGNLSRNRFRGPYQQSWDFSILKNFPITERFNLRFTTDFFNMWNHANFANPSINDVETALCTPGVNGCPPSGLIPNSPFGKIFSTTGTPRLIQFSLRLSF